VVGLNAHATDTVDIFILATTSQTCCQCADENHTTEYNTVIAYKLISYTIKTT